MAKSLKKNLLEFLTGEQFNKVYRTMLHVVYLIGAMIVASFLQAPFVTRATIIGLVPINLMTFLKHGMDSCLDFTSITTLIFFITGSKCFKKLLNLI